MEAFAFERGRADRTRSLARPFSCLACWRARELLRGLVGCGDKDVSFWGDCVCMQGEACSAMPGLDVCWPIATGVSTVLLWIASMILLIGSCAVRMHGVLVLCFYKHQQNHENPY